MCRPAPRTTGLAPLPETLEFKITIIQISNSYHPITLLNKKKIEAPSQARYSRCSMGQYVQSWQHCRHPEAYDLLGMSNMSEKGPHGIGAVCEKVCIPCVTLLQGLSSNTLQRQLCISSCCKTSKPVSPSRKPTPAKWPAAIWKP